MDRKEQRLREELGRCAICYQAGNWVVPRKGIFARVLTGGSVSISDIIEVVPNG